jgi:hypothetical protein
MLRASCCRQQDGVPLLVQQAALLLLTAGPCAVGFFDFCCFITFFGVFIKMDRLLLAPRCRC